MQGSDWIERREKRQPQLRRQKQVDLCESEATLVCRASSRTAKVTQRNLVAKTTPPSPSKKVTTWSQEILPLPSREGKVR